MERVNAYLAEHQQQFESTLSELLKIASVSADSQFAGEVQRAADWMQQFFTSLGMKSEILPTPGYPVVYAEWIAAEEAPTVLVYGHYDVQPPDPLDEWISPPFEPTIRDGKIYARGATDDKGQMLTHVLSAKAWLESEQRLPVNVKYLIEGEEEVGSAHLEEFIDQHKDRLGCDVVVISDTAQFGPEQPAITYGLRGITYYELLLYGPKQDLHSGVFGGAVPNPAIVLSKLLGSLLGDDGVIQVPGFYDDVLPLSEHERGKLSALPFEAEEFQKRNGLRGLAGEAGYSTLERRWARPSYDVNGLFSGYQGEGAKTVLPAKAGAKFSFRLVPNQDPLKIHQALEPFLREQLPPGIEMELKHFDGHAPGVLVPLESPYLKAAERAITQGFGKQPVFIREGGSIPIVNTFSEKLGVDTLLLGWGQNDDNLHSPNEKFNLHDFHRGIQSSAHLWNEIALLNA